MEGTIIENSLQNATVEIVKLINNSDQRNDLYSEMRIWDLYIPNQFPVMNVEQHGNKVVLTTANPHEHYTIHAKFVNNKLEGKAILKTPQDEVIARFSYSAGEMSGFCKIYYKSGKLFYKGYLLNGYRHGKGKEYDENGDITFDGYFKNGSANPYLKRVTNMKDYWRETDISGNVVFVGRKDNYGRNIGYCYLFESGSLKSESFFQHGKELFRSKLFINEIMLEYNNNVVTYNGTYHGSIETGFERRCGIEYDKTGQRKVYNGDFVKGKHVGYGVSYDINNQIKYNGEWIYGMSLKTFNTICITLPIIFELCLTVYTFFIFIPMYQCILSFVILLISLILYHYIRKAWLLCPLTSDFVPRTGEMPHQYNDKAVISSNMFKSVKEFRIDGLRNLNKLEIMNYSFTKAKPKENKNTKLIFDNEKSFHILNCESLESIKIGKFSFSDFAGDFELKNLPALQSIQIGTIGSNDLCNFYCSSFVIRGILNDVEY